MLKDKGSEHNSAESHKVGYFMYAQLQVKLGHRGHGIKTSVCVKHTLK